MSDARQRVHSPRSIQRAQVLAEGGWNFAEITRLLEREGVIVTPTTVKTWVDPDYLNHRRALASASKARDRAKRGVRLGTPRMRPETRFKRMRALHEAGLSSGSIAKVMELDFGMSISAEQVRYSLKTGSLPRSARVEVGGRG